MLGGPWVLITGLLSPLMWVTMLQLPMNLKVVSDWPDPNNLHSIPQKPELYLKDHWP